MSAFGEVLTDRLAAGGWTTEDALASFLPLMRQTVEAHAAGKVAPLEGLDALHVEGVQIWFEQARLLEPRSGGSKVRRLDPREAGAIEVVSQHRRVVDVTEGREEVVDLAIGRRDRDVTRPVYLPGYVAWEHLVAEHDPLVDTFSLGMILASLVCGLDFRRGEDLKAFVANRGNLFRLNRGLHPVLAKAVVRMTELSRHRRVQDLPGVLRSLESYREQEVDFEYDLARIEGFEQRDLKGKQQVILGALEERLFEISRRNRLLHFRATMQTVNLTQASVPLTLYVEHIRPDQILTWSGKFKDDVVAGKPVLLNSYLDFNEVLYLPGALDRIRAESRRDQAEYGFEQLRLVACFLRWANVKEDPPERFDSPLVLIPVRLVKKKGVRDSYWLEPLSDEAQVNPVVRHLFKQLYDIDLPATIELRGDSLDTLHQALSAAVAASEPGITLEKIDRPRIDLIHDQARRRLDSYVRRARVAGRGVRRFMDLDYSYDPANFHPLGLRLYSSMIRRADLHLREVLQDKPSPRHYAAPRPAGAAAVTARQFFTLREVGPDSPYTWEFDLCGVTLGNFKYRKMTLVRDYEDLLDHERSSPAFDAAFSLVPRPAAADTVEAPPPRQRFNVVPCDPTQAAAIELARTQQSYIIQGPPGTGKSQTITNLIADYVARGKRVLFVCEKRAAIDVVYHRLRQCGLDGLCSLIHDSQADKNAFVMDLKASYEGLLADTDDDGKRRRRRRECLLSLLAEETEPMARFSESMLARPAETGLALRDLLDRAIALRPRLPELSALERERLPHYAAWVEHLPRIRRLVDALTDLRADGVFARHPLRMLDARLATVDRPLEVVTTNLAAARDALAEIGRAFRAAGVPAGDWADPATARELTDYAARVEWLAQGDLMGLLDPADPAAGRFAEAGRRHLKQVEVLRQAREATKNWRTKLPPEELAVAISQARALEAALLGFLRPGWWRLRKVLRHCYDFGAHVVKPGWTHVLEGLQDEYAAAARVAESESDIREAWRLEGSVEDAVRLVDDLHASAGRMPRAVEALQQRLLASPRAGETVPALAAAGEGLDRLRRALEAFLATGEERGFEDVSRELTEIEGSLDRLGDFLACLGELAALPDDLAAAIRHMPLAPDELEAAIADHSLTAACRSDRAVSRYSGAARRGHVRRLDAMVGKCRDLNAAVVREAVRETFLRHMRIAQQPPAALTPEEKAFKKGYNRGRRELEHEFGKTMRYKSIRDLVAGESGQVVRDLKPVWLMSPLSVSDTLPLNTDHFDVVIFDEASQITLEEAVPSIFRAAQAIVVGDEMQLPPTNFFSAKRPAEADALRVEDQGQVVEYDLHANSFLNHAGRNLPSRMLGWHYRSRSESLISFSNWAFYQGRLLTVPEEQTAERKRAEIAAAEAADGERNVAGLLDRPVSFHFMTGGVYEKRRNRAEADYIAHMVRKMLTDEAGLSIGIVAFSEAQQDEIESALDRLARDDRAFRGRLEIEFERETDGQFVGLLVKNLENIQGDERDVVIMSVCYGHGPNGKMLMNFGPINQSGGERRLNVAFSRAKHHMALVSSIRYSDITNEYNDGANCLRNYLRYAECCSVGDAESARRVLRELAVRPEADARRREGAADAAIAQLAGALRERLWRVDLAVGMSHFRCDLAVRKDGEDAYRLGILVDTSAYHRQADVIERDLMKPKLLRAFGWQVVAVLAKDLYLNRDAVLARLDDVLAGRAPSAPGRMEAEDLDAMIAEREAALPPEPEAPVPPAPAGGKLFPIAEGATCRFEFRGDASRKFWEIAWAGARFTVRFGRLGTEGQVRGKQFSDAAVARGSAERLIRQKLAKGYKRA